VFRSYGEIALKTVLSVTAFLVAVTFGQAAAAQQCSSGSAIIDAVLVLPSGGIITEVDQYAWLGGNQLSHVCDINMSGERQLSFDIFAGEFRSGQGICMSYTNADGTSQYSCARAAEIEAARNAARGSPGNTLRFVQWSAGLPRF
jgi:hypothetical protein